MSDKYARGSNGCDTLNGVKCDVKNCKHHTPEDRCTASSIKVESSSAMNKTETWCGTFMPN